MSEAPEGKPPRTPEQPSPQSAPKSSSQSGPVPHKPDLPRTAGQRLRVLRTGWTTGGCASAAARVAAPRLVAPYSDDAGVLP